MVDIGSSHKDRKLLEEKGAAPPPKTPLKLYLSDGKQQYLALDLCGALVAARVAAAQSTRVRRINDRSIAAATTATVIGLDEAIPPGTKVWTKLVSTVRMLTVPILRPWFIP